MDILTKKQNYRLWQSGAFGNKLRAWRTVEEWRASDFLGKIAIRQLAVGGGICLWDVPLGLVDFEFERLTKKEGIDPANLMINEMSPNESAILQGEYLNGVREFEGETIHGIFLHTRVRTPMRGALLVFPQISHGLRSDLLIKEAMTPASHEDWQELLTRYPDHVLEVSIFDHCLGDLPHRNALVWEVRKY